MKPISQAFYISFFGEGYSSMQWSGFKGAWGGNRKSPHVLDTLRQKYRAAGIIKINGLIKTKTKRTDYFAGFLFTQTIKFYYAYGVALLESKVPKNAEGFRFPSAPP